MAIRNLTSRATDAVGSVVNEVTGLRKIHPESEHALAAWLFERIDENTGDKGGKDRAYYLELMRDCLAVVRQQR